MNTLIFQVEADELDTHVLDSIKAFFGHRKIEISVKSASPLADIIERGKHSKTSYRVPHEVIIGLADALEADDASVDVVAEISKYKRVDP